MGIRIVGSLFPLVCHIVAIPLLLRLDLNEEVHAKIRARIRDRLGGLGGVEGVGGDPVARSSAAGAWPLSARAARREDGA